MRHSIKLLFMLTTLSIYLFSCGSGEEDEAPEITDPNVLISPSDANALSQVLIMPSGASLVTDQLPAPSNSPEAPVANSFVDGVTSSNGSTAPINFGYDNVSGNLGGCYVQVDGATSYFDVPYSGSSGSGGTLQLPVGIPSNVDEGSFSLSYCVYDNSGRLSNVIQTTVSVLRLGTGSLQISLSWDNSSDQDLYVTEPSGEVISYLNSLSLSGGELDRDDLDGFGPENIFWSDEAPDGTYRVEVNDYDGVSSTGYIVTVTGPNTSRSFTGTTSNGSTSLAVTFTKSGNNLSF